MTPFNSILGTLEELRALFVLGRRSVPLLEDVVLFVEEIAPLLKEIDGSLKESTGQMPHATSRLSSVSEATELATTEMLDMSDQMLDKVDEIGKHNELATQALAATRQADASLIRLLRQELAGHNDALLARVEHLHEAKKMHRQSLNRHLEAKQGHLDQMSMIIQQIMLSLQVHDITSQQIASVQHLIETVRFRLEHLKTGLWRSERGSRIQDALAEQAKQQARDLQAPKLPAAGSFDPHARYDHSSSRQAMADALLSAQDAAAPPAEAPTASNDDIDALFASAPAAPVAPASNDDIDALFARPPAPNRGPIPAAPASASASTSQDEIDKLFG